MIGTNQRHEDLTLEGLYPLLHFALKMIGLRLMESHRPANKHRLVDWSQCKRRLYGNTGIQQRIIGDQQANICVQQSIIGGRQKSKEEMQWQQNAMDSQEWVKRGKQVVVRRQQAVMDGQQRIMAFNVLMLSVYVILIICYFGKLVHLLVTSWNYDTFLGNCKDALNMIYLLSVYYLTFKKRKVGCKFFRNLSVFGLPKMKRWLKVLVILTALVHSTYAFYLCSLVQENTGSCIAYTAVTYSIPFLVDIQLLLHLASVVHIYRKVNEYLATLKLGKRDKQEKYSQVAPMSFTAKVILGSDPQVVSDVCSDVLQYKKACWYLIYMNHLLNKVGAKSEICTL